MPYHTVTPTPTVTPTVTPNTFDVTNSGSGNYLINGVSNPILTLTRGQTYTFNVSAVGHPFWIKTVLSTGIGNVYNTGVENNGIQNGTLIFVVSNNAPNTLYYNCQFHSSMAGTINIINGLQTPTLKKGNEILYHKRPYLKVGGFDVSEYRAVVVLSPRQALDNAMMSVEGFTMGMPYTIGNATLSLSLLSGSTGGHLAAFLMPLNVPIDESVTWERSTLQSDNTMSDNAWWTLGGDLETEIAATGSWNENTVSFDVTPFLNIWNTRDADKLAITIRSLEDSEKSFEVLEFHSWESDTVIAGGGALTNCNFLAGGNANSTQTEGVRVLVSNNGNTTITLADERNIAIQQWNSFGAVTGVGATFTFYSPDTEQGVVLGSVSCTVLDRTSTTTGSPLVVSGISLPNAITQYYTTAEFTSNSVIPTGTNILEILTPSAATKESILSLTTNQTILINYRAGVAANNAKAFTVKFVADETLKQNRVRVYLVEATVSENRTGLNTEIITVQNQPSLTVDLLLS